MNWRRLGRIGAELAVMILAITLAVPATAAYALTVTRVPVVYAKDGTTHDPVSGASVRVDEALKGETDSSGALAFRAQVGPHRLTMSKSGYEVYNATVNIQQSNSTLTAYMTSAATVPANRGYTIFIDVTDGNKIEAKNSITGNVDYVGADPAAVLQSAINALAATGGTILLTSGTYAWGSIPALPRNLPNWLKIVGDGLVTIRLTTSGPRAFDFDKKADYDIFKNIWIENLVIDCNDVGGQNHVVLGTYQNGAVQTRINIMNIVIRNIITQNVPVDPTTGTERLNVMLVVRNDAPQKQINITGIKIENCDFRGGNSGIFIGTTSPARQGQNVFIDDVHILNCRHSLLSVQKSVFASANFQIGASGFGGYVEIANSYGEYSGDVGVEINALNALVQNVTIKDAAAFAFYHTNYNYPQSGSSQFVEFKDCVALKVGVPSSLTGKGWGITGWGGVALGKVVLDNCTFHTSAPSFVDGEAVAVGGPSDIGLTGVTLSRFTSAFDVDYSGTADNTINPIFITGTGATTSVTLQDIGLVVRGSRSPTAGRLSVAGMRLAGNMNVNADGISIDYNVSGASVMIAVDIGIVPSTLMGVISRVVVKQMAGSSNIYGIVVRGTNTLTIPGQLGIKSCDFSAMSGGTPMYFEEPSNKSQIQVTT